MKVGDVVKWIGFPGATMAPKFSGPSTIGIVVEVICYRPRGLRVSVSWGDGTMGENLYAETLEVING